MATSQQYGFGSGIAYGIRTDIANQTPVRLGVMQDISVDFSSETKELYGQLQFPVDVARGKMKISGKAKFALIEAAVYNTLFFAQTLTTGQEQFVYNEAGTVPSMTPITGMTSAGTASGNGTLTFSSTPAGVLAGFSVADTTTAASIAAGTGVVSKTSTTVVISPVAAGAVGSGDTISFTPALVAANAATFVQDLGVYYANNGTPLTYVTSAPTQGQYTVNSQGGYGFATADVGAAVLINYIYNSSTSGNSIAGTNLLMGTTPTFQLVFNQLYRGKQTVLTLYSCTSSKLNFATKIDDYMIPEFDFMAFADPSGRVFNFNSAG